MTNNTLAPRSTWSKELAQGIIAKWQSQEGAVMPILLEMQETFGYVHQEAVDLVAVALNVARSQVYGTLSFYHDFKKEPQADNQLKICCAEACQASGSRELLQHLSGSHQIDLEKGAAVQNNMAVEKVYCLGNCACGPSAMLNDEVYARVSVEQLDEWLKL